MIKPIVPTLLAVFIFMVPITEVMAQTDNEPPGPKYAIHTDLGLLGYGGVFTFNFEFLLGTNQKAVQLRVRSGFGTFGLGDWASSTSITGAPSTLPYW